MQYCWWRFGLYKNSQLFLGLVDIIESNDVRMVDELHDGNLALDASMHGGLVGQRGFGDDLDGDLLIGLAMASEFDTA